MEAWAKIYKELLEYNKRQTDFLKRMNGKGFEQTLYQREYRWQVSHEEALTTNPHSETPDRPYWGVTAHPLESGAADTEGSHGSHGNESGTSTLEMSWYRLMSD